MTSLKHLTPFPAGNDDFRSQRLRADQACALYNRDADDASPQVRAALYLNIVNANKSLSQKQLQELDQSQVDELVHSSPGRSTLQRGSSPESEEANDEASIFTEQTAVTLVESNPPLKGFPGQGLVPYIKPPLNIDYGTTLFIAPSTFVNRGFKVLDTPIGYVKIGERCLIGPDVHLYAVSHPTDYRDRKGPADAPSYATDIEIDDDCWIGGRVTILGGVKIGKGVVIGAGSVVNRDIPPYHLAVGCPARPIKRIAGPPENNWTWYDFRAVLQGWYNRRWRLQVLVIISLGVSIWSLYQQRALNQQLRL